MSFTNPIFPVIPRQSVVGQEGVWVKMFDPPTSDPPTPELVPATNPVPEIMLAAGLQDAVVAPHTVNRHMMTGEIVPAWDGTDLDFFMVSDDDNPTASGGTWPGATIRIPRGVVFHCQMRGAGPPPHTIHWHGIEPTAINDGVGHCSMEVGAYLYQFQPNQIGSYFYHCHRNTVQHFEFGLYGFMIIDPPDAFFASCAPPVDPRPAGAAVTLNAIPIGACRDGRRRTAANLARVGQQSAPGTGDAHTGAGFENIVDMSGLFPGYVHGALTDPDLATTYPDLPSVPLSLRGQPLPDWLKFATNPHAMTVPYDVEVLWVTDDRDSVWSANAGNARQTFPVHGTIPGVNDVFDTDRASWAAFNQFNADYWFVTGVGFPGPRGGSAAIGPNIVVPAALMSGVAGVQVSVDAQVNQTILLRCLNGAYNDMTVTLPVEAVIVAWDGRGLGVGPLAQYNHAYLLPANTPIHISVARRFDALIRPTAPISSFATVQFTETTHEEDVTGGRPVIFTGQIPFNIRPAVGAASISGSVIDSKTGEGIPNVQVNLSGASAAVARTDSAGNYSFAALPDGSFVITPSQAGVSFAPPERGVMVSGADVVGQFFRGRRP